jgi:Dolichyl-phosphate-mannose-protein mannosyltransferase
MSAVTAVRARALAIPAWLWLAGIVVVSAAARIALARRMVAPWIMVDELVYSELAKSVAAHGHFQVRDVPVTGYGFVYPLLIAPAWRLFGAVPDAYVAAKTINAVVMSLTAVPAYFLARRLLAPALSLVAAVLAVLVPSMLYTGTLMTENAFYPLFVLTALVLVLMLERPTLLLQVGVLVLCLVAYETRAQAIALLAAVATAPLLLALIERRRRVLRPFVPLYGLLAGAALVALLATVARGRSPFELLGAYRAATDSTYSTHEILRYVLYHFAELDLYLGVVPFAALLTLWFAPRAATPAARAFAAASLALTAWLVVEVAAFASQPSVARIEERNMFYVAPLALIALVGLAANGVIPTRRRAVVAAAVVAGLLPFTIPFDRLITTSAVSDTFALLPWWWVHEHWMPLDHVRYAALAAAAGAALLFLLLPRRFALLLPALVAVYFVATAAVVENGRHGIRKASIGSLWAGIRVLHPDWVDRAVGRDGDVAALWSGNLGIYTVWENEFFNRSVGPVYTSAGPSPGGLPETQVSRRADGRLVTPDGRVVRARYVLADGSQDIEGRPIARDPRIGLQVYETNGPLVVPTKIVGLYPADTWSGRRVTYTRVDCAGGELSVLLGSDPNLFRGGQVVSARIGGKVVGRARIAPAGEARLRVPLRRGAGGKCVVDFTVARTKVPADVVRGSTDDRALGAHFLRFDYRP